MVMVRVRVGVMVKVQEWSRVKSMVRIVLPSHGECECVR